MNATPKCTCKHPLPNKSNFMTMEQRVCPECKTVYWYDGAPVMFERITYKKEIAKNAK